VISGWRHRSLRFRLALWYAVGGTVLLAGFSATLYFYVSERIARPLDHQLRRDLETIQRRLEIAPDNTLRWDGRELVEGEAWTTQYPWFELWDEDSQLVRRLWPFAEGRVERVPVAPVRGRETISVFRVAPDLRLRSLSIAFPTPGNSREWYIRLLRMHEPATDALGELRWIIFIALPVVIALLVVGGYTITRRWLTPLNTMTTEANRITADDFSRRLPIVNPHDELGQLASVFNVTLDRLEASFTALDRFVADASHELRTPLTTLRSVGEVGLRRGRTVEEYREIIGSMLEEGQRLQLLIGRLLELATAEGGETDVHREELQIDDFVRNCVHDLNILAEARGQQLLVTAEPCQIRTDPVIFRQALQNLIDNAVKFSPEGAIIRVKVDSDDNEVRVSVSDEGPGISPENQQHLAKRFFRPDRGRNRSAGGFGLGLSITKAYMRVLGGSLQYTAMMPRGSQFTLHLPRPRDLTSHPVARQARVDA
jgi:two-component system, OmpR family, sensor kinase